MTLVSKPPQDQCLSAAEQDAFDRARRRVVIAFGGIFLLCVALVIAGSYIDLNDYAWWVLALFFFSVINAIFASWRYKCPRCGKTPSTKRLSFGDDVQYSGAVAFFPKVCGGCGVSFRRPADEQPDIPR